MLFAKLEDIWATTLTYEGGAIWPIYPEGGPPMLDIPAAPLPTKPKWQSKILWTAIVSVVVYVITDLANLDPTTKAAFITVFGALQNAAIGVMRVWYTSTALK